MLIGEIVKVGDNNLSRLEEAVETHVKHEENVVFSLAREHLGKDLVDWDRK
jgi:hemerythrin-like domain-containing protein